MLKYKFFISDTGNNGFTEARWPVLGNSLFSLPTSLEKDKGHELYSLYHIVSTHRASTAVIRTEIYMSILETTSKQHLNS